jgi:two-component system chemotaxis response regulator CheY
MATQRPMSDILIVDDDYAIREMLTEVLEDAGYSVRSAENGAQALKQLRERAELPRLILLDLMMPVMTGWEFHREQQSDARLAAIPVIVLSARPGLEREGFAMAVAGFIPKPMNVGSLLDLVVRYCS